MICTWCEHEFDPKGYLFEEDICPECGRSLLTRHGHDEDRTDEYMPPMNEIDKTFWCKLCGVRHRKSSRKGRVHYEWLKNLPSAARSS